MLGVKDAGNVEDVSGLAAKGECPEKQAKDICQLIH